VLLVPPLSDDELLALEDHDDKEEFDDGRLLAELEDLIPASPAAEANVFNNPIALGLAVGTRLDEEGENMPESAMLATEARGSDQCWPAVADCGGWFSETGGDRASATS
jgi:hypothetical protein